MREIQTVSQSTTAFSFVERPYAHYEKIRALGDFVYWKELGMPVATTFEAVDLTMRHKKLGRETPKDELRARPDHLSAYYRIYDSSLLRTEAPEHNRLRKTVSKAFERAKIMHKAIEISMIADRVIGELPKDTTFDIQALFADRLPSLVSARLLGVPEQMHSKLNQWSRAISGMLRQNRDAHIETAAEDASREFSEYMLSYVEERRKEAPRDDFVGALLEAEKDGHVLTNDELVAMSLVCIQAGNEGMAYSIGHSILNINGLPDRATSLAPEQISTTVEECLRHEAPLQFVTRHVNEDTSIMGKSFERGEKIGCLIGSACHDDAVWPDGDTFDPYRLRRRSPAFGAGVHACIGTALANMIMQISLPALFSRCPNLRVIETPKYANDFIFRRLESLMVAI